jgi:DNA-binding beta-propeller fold protein YncE
MGLAAILSVTGALTPALGSTLFLGGYPDKIVLFDEGTGTTTEKIKLDTGLPISMRLSNDKKKLYITTLTTGGIEVMDVATKRIINKFSLNDGNTKYRFTGGVPDPTGRYFYTIAAKMEKQIDRYKIGKPQYIVVDLQLKKIVRSADLAPEDDLPNYSRGALALSEDGKSLYLFRDKIAVIDTATLKVVQHIDLAKPEMAGMENVSFGGGVQTQQSNSQFVSLFNSADPYVHNKVFGVARLDLATREFNFTPIGPAPASMSGLEISPDGKEGYTAVSNLTLGNKRCEFWRFDLTTNKVIGKAEFECRSRFQFGMSGDGQKLYIYGASFDIEVYDAKTLKLEKTWDLGNDATMAGMVIPN